MAQPPIHHLYDPQATLEDRLDGTRRQTVRSYIAHENFAAGLAYQKPWLALALAAYQVGSINQQDPLMRCTTVRAFPHPKKGFITESEFETDPGLAGAVELNAQLAEFTLSKALNVVTGTYIIPIETERNGKRQRHEVRVFLPQYTLIARKSYNVAASDPSAYQLVKSFVQKINADPWPPTGTAGQPIQLPAKHWLVKRISIPKASFGKYDAVIEIVSRPFPWVITVEHRNDDQRIILDTEEGTTQQTYDEFQSTDFDNIEIF